MRTGPLNPPRRIIASKMPINYPVDLRRVNNAQSVGKRRAPGKRMAFKLYNAPQSTCSQRVRFVFNAKSIPFDEVKLNLLEGDQLKPDYLKLNPNGVVPTLDHDGAIVTDSPHRHHRISPRGPPGQTASRRSLPLERARMRALMHFIDEMPAAAVRVPTFNLAFLPDLPKMSRDTFIAHRPVQAAAARIHAGHGAERLSASRRWTRRSPACAAPTSAWTPRSKRAAGRGCWARTSRSPTWR